MKRKEAVLLFLIFVNLAGMLFGAYYYSVQFTNTSPLLWIFVPDCPLYVFAFAIALFLLRKGRENNAFSFIVSAGLLKYGVWTLFALAFFNAYFFAPQIALLSGTLFILHIGMAAEGFVLRVKKCGIGLLLLGLAWFLLNDFVDYFFGTTPYLPVGADLKFVAMFSIASTLVLVPLVWLTKRRGLLVPLGIYQKR